MLLVLLLHSNYFSLGGVDFTNNGNSFFPSFVKAFSEQLCVICVNVFVLISGWFGIRPTLKGACSLLFQVLFYHVLIVLVLYCAGLRIDFVSVLKGCYFGSSYWFVMSYLVLYALSPILNEFVKSATFKQFISVLVAFFFLEFVYFMVPNSDFLGGYSSISFIGLYLLAQFLRNHSKVFVRFGMALNFTLYVVFSLFPILLLFLINRQGLSYCSPFVVAASMFFFLAFTKMKFSSKIVNYLACSSFCIYLIHLNPMVVGYFKDLMRYMYDHLGGLWYMGFAVFFAIVFSLICMLFDKIRIMIWNWLCCKFLNRIFLILENACYMIKI